MQQGFKQLMGCRNTSMGSRFSSAPGRAGSCQCCRIYRNHQRSKLAHTCACWRSRASACCCCGCWKFAHPGALGLLPGLRLFVDGLLYICKHVT